MRLMPLKMFESHIADQILGSGSTSHEGERSSSFDLNEGLQKAIVEMEAIKNR